MPELPEVETVRRTLEQLVVGRKIERVTVQLPRIIQRIEPEVFCRELIGQTIRGIGRRGKFLRIVMDQLVIVSHLRMEGRYGLFRADELIEKHTHVIFHFDDGMELRYKDVRQFGTMELFELGQELELPPLSKLGVEPLSETFTTVALRRMLEGRSAPIKPLLLNQAYVVGIGNIYVDESLHRARIHPLRPAETLSPAEWTRLHEAIVLTLSEAIAMGGSSVKSYVNGQGEMGMFQQQLAVYGRKDQPCQVCGSSIVKTVVGGRGTHYCAHCQPVRSKK
jgi:formamidopyrimidine-DNA glycosylase